jgi:hypothetical protein
MFNAWQDWSSARTMDSISGDMLADGCFVLRDGNRAELQAVDLVPGDIIYIKIIDLSLAERKIAGDATDQAVLRSPESLGLVRDLHLLWKKSSDLAFNSKNKFVIRTLSLVDPEGPI